MKTEQAICSYQVPVFHDSPHRKYFFPGKVLILKNLTASFLLTIKSSQSCRSEDSQLLGGMENQKIAVNVKKRI